MAITIDLKLGGNALTDLDNYADAMAKIAPLAKQIRGDLAGNKGTWLTKAANEAERLNKALANTCLMANNLVNASAQIAQNSPSNAFNNATIPPKIPGASKGGRGPAIPNTPAVSIARSLLSTRFPIFGSSMLGKDVLNIAGINPQSVLKAVAGLGPTASAAASALGPLAVAAIAVTAAFNAAQMSAEAINADRKANAITGGSASQSAGARAVAASIGLSTSAVSGVSSAIAGGGVAGAVGMRLGISPIRGGAVGDLNDASAFTKVTDAIRRAKTQQEALRLADIFGNRELVQVRDLSNDTYSRLKNVNASNPSQRKAAAEFDAEMTIFFNQLDRLKYSLSPLVKEFADFTGGVNELFNVFSGNADWVKMVQGIAHSGDVVGIGIPGLSTIIDQINGMGGKKQEAEAREKQTRAINENTRAIKQGREALGGGSRTQGAIPSGITGMTIDAAIQAQGIRLGVL